MNQAYKTLPYVQKTWFQGIPGKSGRPGYSENQENQT